MFKRGFKPHNNQNVIKSCNLNELHDTSSAHYKSCIWQHLNWLRMSCLSVSPHGELGINFNLLGKGRSFDMKGENMIIKSSCSDIVARHFCSKYSCISFSTLHFLWFCIHTFAPNNHGSEVVSCLAPIQFWRFYRLMLSKYFLFPQHPQ